MGQASQSRFRTALAAGVRRCVRPSDVALVSPAERHASTPRRTAREITAAARTEFPSYADDVAALGR
ncbi:hypothetical protein [Streptomyces sp. NPDC012466]|jgi:hypothetical protein|uniref:hypothetical protein n=1 Tax=Streptomyces sp. NPDC012466 TaxID=3364835 RepID=UPI0036E89BDD